MENNVRRNLVTTFNCTDCGNALNLAYNTKPEAANNVGRDDRDGLTGATVKYNRVYIEPCAACIGKVRKPLQQMRDAIASLTENTNNA